MVFHIARIGSKGHMLHTSWDIHLRTLLSQISYRNLQEYSNKDRNSSFNDVRKKIESKHLKAYLDRKVYKCDEITDEEIVELDEEIILWI